MENVGKKFYLSKTFWVNFVLAVLLPVSVYFELGIEEFLKEHITESGAIWGIINLILRLVTVEPIEWKK